MGTFFYVYFLLFVSRFRGDRLHQVLPKTSSDCETIIRLHQSLWGNAWTL